MGTGQFPFPTSCVDLNHRKVMVVRYVAESLDEFHYDRLTSATLSERYRLLKLCELWDGRFCAFALVCRPV